MMLHLFLLPDLSELFGEGRLRGSSACGWDVPLLCEKTCGAVALRGDAPIIASRKLWESTTLVPWWAGSVFQARGDSRHGVDTLINAISSPSSSTGRLRLVRFSRAFRHFPPARA